MHLNFKRPHLQGALILIVFAAASFTPTPGHATDLDAIGVTSLRSVSADLDGAGVRVAQVESEVSSNPPAFEVRPDAVGQPTALFTYTSKLGSSRTFPNSTGAESKHAEEVAAYFYGIAAGVATNVAHVHNFDAVYFWSAILAPFNPPNINAPVVNQSFVFLNVTVAAQRNIDSAYDNYAADYKKLFVSGAGNDGPVAPPATCYNGIGVAAYGGLSSVGRTPDNGRAKPDITAPAPETSFSAPQVAGAAAILLQAGRRGDGGGNTGPATDIRTVKALLLNGAVKPSDWTNTASSPLDVRYGAGILNVFNSYEQLAAGRHRYIVSRRVPIGGSHPPTVDSGTVDSLSGWDFNVCSSSGTFDGVNHYFFDATNGVSGAIGTATATLVWNRHPNEAGINNLDLFLYDANSGNLITCSTSVVDNVEHLFAPLLPPGRYDLQVLKHGGTMVSRTETYGLAFEFSLAGSNSISSQATLSPAGAVSRKQTGSFGHFLGAGQSGWVVVEAKPRGFGSIPAE